MAKINIISSCVVKSATANSISRLELTPWDLRYLRIFPIQRGLLFHKPAQSHQTLIQHLKHSLSRTLDFFPPLAGRLSTTGGAATFSVVCNNAGAEFVHAVAASVAVSDITEPEYIPEFVASSLFPLNDVVNMEGTLKPLMAVQVTELVDGLFIGCAANHAVVDGASFWHFVNSWSEISRGFLTISKPPIFDRSFASKVAAANLLPPPPLMVENEISPPPPLLKRVFHFSKESMAKLKSEANSEAGTDKISSFQAISALLWRTSTLSQQPKSIHNLNTRKVNMLLIVNARSRIGLSDSYFGNAVYTAPLSVTESELLQNGIGHTALKINELVTQQINGEAAIRSLENSVNHKIGARISSFFIVDSPRSDVYGSDFGWGKPIAVRSGKGREDDGKFTVFPAAESGGVDLEVCVAAGKMAAMEDDAEFMASLTV